MDTNKKAPGWKRWLAGTSSEWKLRLIVALGLLGMALILLSQVFSSGTTRREVDTETARFVSEEYITEMEKKLTDLVTGMEGVGRAQVMVTLESGVEYVYAQEEKRNVDMTREGEATAVAKVYEKENVEQRYILVDENGKKQPLLQTELEPTIKGVVIVCDGAGTPRVEQDLINVITTALDLPSTRVCIVKIDSNSDREREETK